MPFALIQSTPQTPLIPRSIAEDNDRCCKAPSCTQIVNGIATASLAGYATGLGIAQHKGKIVNPLKDAIIVSALGLASLVTIYKVFMDHYHKVEGDSMIRKGCKSGALTGRDTLIGATSVALATGVVMIAFVE